MKRTSFSKKLVPLLSLLLICSVLNSGCGSESMTATATESVDAAQAKAFSTEQDKYTSQDFMSMITDNREVFISYVSEENAKEIEEVISQLTLEQRNSINMLNYLTVMTQEINASSNSRLFLEAAYSELLNNTEPSIVDELALDEYEKLFDVINRYRLIAVKRERIKYIYNQNSANALRSAIPNPLSILNVVQSKNTLKSIVSLVYLPFDSYNSYKSYSNQSSLQYIQDDWALDDEESENLHDSRSSMFSYMVRVARSLPAGITLNEESVENFVKWENEENITSRIRWLESNQNVYKNYGEYWLVLAESYYEKARTDGKEYYMKCLEAIGTYEKLDIHIFRYDIRFAQTLPYAIIAARETMSEADYITTAGRCAQLIRDNTKTTDWSLRYFAAQTFLDIYSFNNTADALQCAYDIALDNVNELLAEQKSLNETYLADLVLTPTDGTEGDEKDAIKKYNKMLEEERKVELPPVYEPLRLNCDLLLALAEKIEVPDSVKKDINTILHPNGSALFLNVLLNAAYKLPSVKNTGVNNASITYDKGILTVPARYVTDSTKISVTISNKERQSLAANDWVLKKVDRNKSNDIKKFNAVYTSKTAEKGAYDDGAILTVTITPMQDASNTLNEIVWKFDVSNSWHSKASFKRR